MRNRLPLILIFLLSVHAGKSQRAVTTGDQSPIIKGAKSKIDYINEQHLKLQIPVNLTPYLAGLLMCNNLTAISAIDAALLAWTKKYNELKSIISKSDPNSRAKA